MTKTPSIDQVFQINRGEKLFQEDRFEDAWALADQILKKDPEDIQARYLMGRCALRLGRPAEAVDHFALLLEKYPEDPVYLAGLGEALVGSGQSDKAIDVLFHAIARDPENLGARAYLGIAFSQQEQYRTAAEILEEVLKAQPSFKNNLHAHLARCYLGLGELERSLEQATAALRLGYSHPADLEQTIGYLIYAIRGDKEEAGRHFMRALELDPQSGDAFYHYTTIRKFKQPDPKLLGLAERNLQHDMPAFKRAYYHFGLGKIHDDLGDWETAFSHYQRANIIAKTPVSGDLEELEALAKGFRKTFQSAFFAAHEGLGNDTEQPIFILGMPRSGSTLTEQILTSHPQVTTGGEIPGLPRVSQKACFDKLSLDARVGTCFQDIQGELGALVNQIAEGYLAILHQYGKEFPRIVDKLPGNLFFIGVIRLVFPRAHIIHTVRNPLDTCLSCFFQPFREASWSNDFSTIGRYYQIAETMMAHWRRVLPPGAMLEVVYEDLVEDTETQARRIIAHCGLDWDDRCLDFHRAKRAVATASLWQVRQPVYKTSKQRWVHYAPHLGPLVKALGPYGKPYYDALEQRGCPVPRSPLQRLGRLFKGSRGSSPSGAD